MRLTIHYMIKLQSMCMDAICVFGMVNLVLVLGSVWTIISFPQCDILQLADSNMTLNDHMKALAYLAVYNPLCTP